MLGTSTARALGESKESAAAWKTIFSDFSFIADVYSARASWRYNDLIFSTQGRMGRFHQIP
jgi:hypothetical protein